MLSAAIANSINMIILNPFELVKQNMQYSEFSQTRTAIKTIWQRRGIRGFYAGYLPLLVRELPYATIDLACFEFLLKKFKYVLCPPVERAGGPMQNSVFSNPPSVGRWRG